MVPITFGVPGAGGGGGGGHDRIPRKCPVTGGTDLDVKQPLLDTTIIRTSKKKSSKNISQRFSILPHCSLQDWWQLGIPKSDPDDIVVYKNGSNNKNKKILSGYSG
jgi:hypothetical protein